MIVTGVTGSGLNVKRTGQGGFIHVCIWPPSLSES